MSLHPETSDLPPHPISLGCPRAPALGALLHALNLHWSSILYMVMYIFQCYSLKSSHPQLLPLSPKVCSLHLCLLCCLTCKIVSIVFFFFCHPPHPEQTSSPAPFPLALEGFSCGNKVLIADFCFVFIFLFYFFKFYFIFKFYIIVLVLPNIKMNPPQVYMCSLS